MKRSFAIVVAASISLSGCWYNIVVPELDVPSEIADLPMEPIPNPDSCARERMEYVSCTLDGDTFDIGSCGENGERIRMLGVSAPEIDHGDAPEECYGNEATTELTRLINRRDVLLTFDKECVGVFGRTLAYVWLPLDEDEIDDPEDDSIENQYLLVNTWMIERGFARLFPEEQFGTLLLQGRFNAAEAEASARRAGLWNECESQ